MEKENLFKLRPEKYPQIYVYSVKEIYPGLLKIGYTTRKNVNDRIKEQFNIEFPNGKKPYVLEYFEDAIKEDGDVFDDRAVHKILKKKGFECVGGEWFKCSVADIKAVILSIKQGKENVENRTQSFKMRPEQEEAVNKTYDYFNKNKGKQPKFLWNAKMRFGKTFTTYQLAKKMDFDRILVLTYKPAVENSWREDLLSHIDFEGWQFYSNNYNESVLDKSKPIVCFGSFQDFLGKTESGDIKSKNKWIFEENWDLIVFDEYHFGAWKDSAKEIYDEDYFYNNQFDDKNVMISSEYKLYLSGTPFRALSTGEFLEDQIYNWTYSDEQKAKLSWVGKDNPYEALPKMILLTYKLPKYIQDIGFHEGMNEFDLNTFFKAEGEKDNARFKYENEVQKWLDLIRGDGLVTSMDNIKLGAKTPPFPFSDSNLSSLLSHNIWFLPDVSSCYAMKNLLTQPQNRYYNRFEIVVSAGESAGVGLKALKPVKDAMGDALKTNTITLTCGKLTTGVTVEPWTGIFMLRNLSSPETYFQAAFRVQSPWVIKDESGRRTILKHQCFVFDFAPDRALRQISDFCNKNNFKNNKSFDLVEEIQEFLNFLPVLAYDGYAMEQVNAEGLLDIAIGGTTTSLLAKKWNNALLVNVDNDTLKQLISDEKAMDILMSIEAFRNAKEDLNIIINKSENINRLTSKKDANGKLSKSEQAELNNDKKEEKKKREEIKNKLKTLATRLPLFMYLTDDRTKTLHELIYPLEPALFKKVTGLSHKDFEYLVDLGLFNSSLMNQAIYDFRKCEEPSRSYTGINKRNGQNVGGFDIVITQEEFDFLRNRLKK